MLIAMIVALNLVPPLNAAAASCTLSAKLVPSCGVLYGAYAEPRSGETYQQAFIRFESEVRAKEQIIHFYHRGSQLFPSAWEISLANGGRKLLMNWKPEGSYTWAQVAAGKRDGYIDSEAAYLKSHFTKPFYLAIHHEPEDEVRPTAGSGYTAKDYAAMYRHVVNRLRADGITNAVFVLNYVGYQKWMVTPWIKNLWPGDAYVDWIAYDPYCSTPMLGTGSFWWLLDAHWGTSGFRGMYDWIVAEHPGKPIMLAEWGVGEDPNNASYKPNFFKGVPGKLKSYPALKALVYFDKPGPGDIEVDSSTASLQAYRTMLNSSQFNQVAVGS